PAPLPSFPTRRSSDLSVSVALGVAFSTDDRFNADLDPVAGAKAYVVPSGDLMSCQVALPVSSTHAIVVNAYPEIDVRDPCDDAKDRKSTRLNSSHVSS